MPCAAPSARLVSTAPRLKQRPAPSFCIGRSYLCLLQGFLSGDTRQKQEALPPANKGHLSQRAGPSLSRREYPYQQKLLQTLHISFMKRFRFFQGEAVIKAAAGHGPARLMPGLLFWMFGCFRIRTIKIPLHIRPPLSGAPGTRGIGIEKAALLKDPVLSKTPPYSSVFFRRLQNGGQPSGPCPLTLSLKSPAVFLSGWDAAACAAPWLRSAGCALSSPETLYPLPPRCGDGRPPGQNAAAAPFPHAG